MSKFANIESMTASQLRLAGLGLWSVEEDEQGRRLFLFHRDDLEHIPQGLVVETITGRKMLFDRETTSQDHRWGYLPFGVRSCDPQPPSFWERLDDNSGFISDPAQT